MLNNNGPNMELCSLFPLLKMLNTIENLYVWHKYLALQLTINE